jgi:hypothetical protein
MLTGILTSVGIPVLLDLIKTAAPALSRRILGVSVDDQIKIEAANVERLKAIALLESPNGTPSQWVVNLRASFRYIAAAGLILGGLGVVGMGAVQKDVGTIALGIEMAGSPFGFIFGERLVLSYKPGSK